VGVTHRKWWGVILCR